MTPAPVGTFRMVDICFDLRCDDRELADYLRWLLEPFASVEPPSDHYDIVAAPDEGVEAATVILNGTTVLTPIDRDLAARAFAWHLNTRVMQETTSAVAVHAGAVALDGRIVVLPGHADAGKSTLVAALVADGFDYLSDEGALIAPPGGLVHPYPRAISLDDRSLALLDVPKPDRPSWLRVGWLVAPGQLRRGAEVGRAGRVALIAFPCLRPGGGPPLAYRPAAAVRGLADRAPNLALVDRPGFEALVACVRGARTVELAVDRLDEAVGQIRSLLSVTA